MVSDDKYDDFLERSKADEWIQLKALIQDAVENKMIKLSSDGKWHYLNADGTFEKKICDKHPIKDGLTSLYDFFYGNEKAKEEFVSIVCKGRVVIKKDTDDLDVPALIREALERDVIWLDKRTWKIKESGMKIIGVMGNQDTDMALESFLMGNDAAVKDIKDAMKIS